MNNNTQNQEKQYFHSNLQQAREEWGEGFRKKIKWRKVPSKNDRTEGIDLIDDN